MGFTINTEYITGLLRLNFLPVVAVLFMGFFLVTNHKYEPTLTSFFKQMFYLLLVLLFVGNIDYSMIDKHIFSTSHVFISVVSCSLRVLLVLRLITIMSYNITGKIKKILSLPMLCHLVIMIFAFFTNWVIWYDVSGNLHTGIFGYTPHIIVGIYCIYAFYLAHLSYLKNEKTECVIIILEMLISITGVVAECIFHVRGMMLGTIALDMVFYYLHMHICKFYKDPLTGALNRASFYADLKQYETGIVAVYSIDLNGLKQINDTNGHEAGDKLLKSASDMISDCLLPGCFLYRTGGDEFVILCVSMSKRQVGQLTSNLFDIQAKGCDFAFGMHEFVTDVQATFRLADDAMYANKRNMKATK